jgi:hypothetical protein
VINKHFNISFHNDYYFINYKQYSHATANGHGNVQSSVPAITEGIKEKLLTGWEDMKAWFTRKCTQKVHKFRTNLKVMNIKEIILTLNFSTFMNIVIISFSVGGDNLTKTKKRMRRQKLLFTTHQ